MKIIFKTETELVREIDLHEMTDELMQELESTFDNRVIKKYEMTFNDGILVKQCKNINNIDSKMISILTITID